MTDGGERQAEKTGCVSSVICHPSSALYSAYTLFANSSATLFKSAISPSVKS
jgi:hypothetical protein